MKLAIFDLDDTLIDGDCASLWCNYLLRKGVLDDEYLEEEARMMALYRQGQLDMQDYMRLFLRPLQKKRTKEVSLWIDDFLQQDILHRVRSEAVKYINRHQANGDQILIISASADFLVRPIARLMGINHILAINCHSHKGRFSGETVGVLSYREGKITRLKQWLKEQTIQPRSSCFYSDSANDLPLLDWVDDAFVVSPEARLATIAQERQWPILQW